METIFAKIKDVPVCTVVDNFMFTKKMRLEGVHKFRNILTRCPEDWKGWWQLAESPDPTSGAVFYESWLEIQREVLDEQSNEL